MELCDLGSLRNAVTRGYFHTRLSDSCYAADIGKILTVLSMVVRGVEYLHERRLAHGDIKLGNVFLRTDTAHPLGFSCKLGDFGLAKLLNDQGIAFNRSRSGTVSHLAPEVLLPSAKVTPAVDVYAFGIMMYELYTAGHAYNRAPEGEILFRVAHHNMRPRFPSNAPDPFVQLAQWCWHCDPEARPTFMAVREALRDMAAGSVA